MLVQIRPGAVGRCDREEDNTKLERMEIKVL